MSAKTKPEPLAGGTRVDNIQNKTPSNHSIIAFPVHRRRGLSTIPVLVRRYKSIRAPRGNYCTPMPDDIRAVA